VADDAIVMQLDPKICVFVAGLKFRFVNYYYLEPLSRHRVSIAKERKGHSATDR
jgi:hypothetical protein